jgi:hypothetical protein
MSAPLYSIPGVYFESPRGQDLRLKGVPVGVAGFVGYCAPRPDVIRAARKSPGQSLWPIAIETVEQIDEKLQAPSWGHLVPALRGYFFNGGKRALVVGIPDDTVHNPVSILGGGEPGARSGLSALDAAEEAELVLAPDLFLVPPGCNPPDLNDVLSCHFALLDFCRGSREGAQISQGGYFALLDAPPGLSEENIQQYAAFLRGHPAAQFGALYYPWIDVPRRDGSLHRMPACGQIAGIISRASGPPEGEDPGTVASDIGPHISPANKPIIDAVGAEIPLLRTACRELLEIGINCVIPWSGRGLVTWGTRTMSPEEETNQISVRRVLSYIERSVFVGTQWAVFEPNDHNLWKRLKARVEVFLEDLWKKGILVGESPGEAFYVQCDEESNPPLEREAGRVNIVILVRPVRSTEFIVLRITQEGALGSNGAAAGEE